MENEGDFIAVQSGEDNNGVMDRVIFNVFSDKDEYLYKEKLFGERVKTSKIMIN